MPTIMTVDREKLDRLKKAFGPGAIRTVIFNAAKEFAPILWRRLAELTPEGSTGKMRQAWRVTPGKTIMGLIIQNAANYSWFVEFGTKPHTIAPRRKTILAWRSGGRGAASSFQPRSGGTGGNLGATLRSLRGGGSKVVPDTFSRLVHHPGTKRQDITTLAWRDKASTFLVTINRFLDKALARAP